MARILVCGVALIDLVFETDAFPDAPKKYQARDARMSAGGCAGVAAAAIQRLGGRARLVSRLGDDEIGRLALSDLRQAGIDTDLVHVAAGGRTGFSCVCVDRTGERQILSYPGRGPDEFVDAARLGAPDAVLADTRWPAASATALRHARSLGVPGVLDGEAPVSDELVALASHAAFSAQGILEFTGASAIGEAMRIARQRIRGWFCATDGASGTHFFQGDALRQICPPRVVATDTLGAGDVWHGAFALRLTETGDEIRAIRFANVAAALHCTRGGKRAGAHSREQVAALVRSTYG